MKRVWNIHLEQCLWLNTDENTQNVFIILFTTIFQVSQVESQNSSVSEVKGVIWCDFYFSFSLVCYIAVCACIRSAELQSSKSPTKGFINLKEKADPDRAKPPHSNTPSRCGNICVMQLKCSRKERRCGFSNRSSVDAAMSGRRCVFLC